MAKLKTQRTGKSVSEFLRGVSDAQRRKDCEAVAGLMEKATGAKAKMWGPSIIGFGDYRYKYASGRELDWFLTGFSPRKDSLTLYIMPGFDRYDSLLSKLGKHKTGKSCLYIKRLDEVDLSVLRELVASSVARMKTGVLE